MRTRGYHRLAVFVTLAACSGKDSDTARASDASVLTIATPADADALIPQLVQSTQGKQATDMLFDCLAVPTSTLETVGDAGFKPYLASRWSWSSDSLSIAFTLDPKARWHDSQPVRAADVKFSYDLFVDPVVASPSASSFDGIDSVSVRDSMTAVVWWKRRNPEQFFQIVTNLVIVPAHLLSKEPRATLAQSAFAQHPVGTGRYRFEQWTRDRQLILLADTANFRGRPTFNRVVWVVSADPTAASLSVLAGQADVLESVRGDAFVNARKSSRVRTVEYGNLDYAFMVMNTERTVGGNRRLFGDRAMRSALTAALNRPAMVSNALDSLGAVALGPFTRSATGVDTAMHQIRFDAAAAGKTLDSLGWKIDAADKLRKKNGTALRFELLVPTTSATRQKFGVLIQAQLASIGVTVDLSPLEQGMFVSRLEKGDFDAALNMWRTDPSPVSGLRQVWASPHGKQIGANYGRYSNKLFDAIVDSAAVEFNANQRQALFRRAYQLIVDDAAGIWLYEPRNFAAINARIAPTGMRAYAWWAGLADWNVSSGRVANASAAKP
ncbi:MAG: peptide ABC transporter substrate-binding protein [Gemmatimonas sp.]